LKHPTTRLAWVSLLGALSTIAWLEPERAWAQPPPSFSATCETVREQAERLDPSSDELVTIEVTGVLLLAESDGALSYMGLCSDPAPRVLCVTYSLAGYQPGDRVTVAGSYHRNDPDFIVLDPCLHGLPAQLR
jgi:hypothetical protein